MEFFSDLIYRNIDKSYCITHTLVSTCYEFEYVLYFGMHHTDCRSEQTTL